MLNLGNLLESGDRLDVFDGNGAGNVVFVLKG